LEKPTIIRHHMPCSRCFLEKGTEHRLCYTRQIYLSFS